MTLFLTLQRGRPDWLTQGTLLPWRPWCRLMPACVACRCTCPTARWLLAQASSRAKGRRFWPSLTKWQRCEPLAHRRTQHCRPCSTTTLVPSKAAEDDAWQQVPVEAGELLQRVQRLEALVEGASVGGTQAAQQEAVGLASPGLLGHVQGSSEGECGRTCTVCAAGGGVGRGERGGVVSLWPA